MDVNELISHIRQLTTFQPANATTRELDQIAPTMRAVDGWMTGLRAACAGRRDELARTARAARPQPRGPGDGGPGDGGPGDVPPDPGSGDPAGDHAKAGRQHTRSSQRDIARARILTMFPALGICLDDGSISGDHLDAITAAIRDLTPEQLEVLQDASHDVVTAAQAEEPQPFERTLRRLIHRICRDDGLRQLQRQRAATGLKMWWSNTDGMLHLHGKFDPERGAQLLAKLNAATDRQFALPPPIDCPTDPLAKNDQLRALALLALVTGRTDPADSADSAGRATAPVDQSAGDVIVIIDVDTLTNGLHDRSIIEIGDQQHPLPIETLRRLACTANIIPTVLDSNGVTLDLGRTVRLANREQRRALRAMYPACAITGCTTGFDHCKIHHIRWWGSQGGRTDIANLLPLCERHHHLAHEGGWQLSLHPTTRTLTITHPDGHVSHHHPPRHGWNQPRAAARETDRDPPEATAADEPALATAS